MILFLGIPAFNEQSSIGKVISSLPKRIPGISRIKVFVVDDGSSDNTYGIAKKHGAFVVRHILNRGLGGALKTVFEYARTDNIDILATLDADGQHDSRDLLKLIGPVVSNKADIAIGSRWKKSNDAPRSRLLINRLANLLTYIFFGVKTTDFQSGLRVFNKNSIKLIKLQTDGMEVSTEFFREIERNKLKYREIPIKAIYTDYSKSKGQRLENAPNVFIQLLLRLLR